jgi:hypothetical protein
MLLGGGLQEIMLSAMQHLGARRHRGHMLLQCMY